MVMMLPPRRSFMPGRKLLMVRNVAIRLPSTEACQPSSLISSSGPGIVKLPPALATRMSSGPKAVSIWRRILSISAKRVTSATTCMACPPASAISAWTADSAAVSLPLSTTFAPCCANSLAMAAPMPRELPVTRATLSLRIFIATSP